LPRVRELEGEGLAVLTAAGDVADEQAVARIVAAHETAYGRMDALVNAAAYGAGGVPLAEMPTEMLDRHLEVDLRAMFLTIRASLPMLTAAGAEHGKALVVNVSSLAAKGGTPGMTFYAAAKAGVNALTESAQAEARHAGIQFTIFSPGFTATPMARWTREAGVAPEEMVQPSDLGGPALPAAHLGDLPRARDRVHAAGPGRDHRTARRLPGTGRAGPRRLNRTPGGASTEPDGRYHGSSRDLARRAVGGGCAQRFQPDFAAVWRSRVWPCNMRGIKASASHRTPV
jgi:NAD(P)-dependent dehydrogenase (short-subunit alcohol dehydrogenase family)